MRKLGIFAVVAGLVAVAAVGYRMMATDGPRPPAGQAEKKGEANDTQVEKDEHAADRVIMSDERVAAAKIVLLKVQPATLSNTLLLNGVIRANQETLVQVTPRFPGVVRKLQKRIGDQARKDDLMATIESNQSLTSYELKAPIDGTVIDRQVSLGEYASEQKPAFILADLSAVWVDLSVYVQDLNRVRVGDELTIDLGDGGAPVSSRISYVSPVGSSDTQSAIARAVVANPDGRLRPGLFVRGSVILSSRRVSAAIKANALQTMENKTVVFVREGNKLEARPVEVGEQDRDYVEITKGLSVGEVYAAENSFVVKAEIGKSEAEHE
ncbi:efflux RND transporter periplasmic adaptor subunit [Roseiarcaceae bacterium H3SJ34-1]|jgi:membrane fusion protein, heavy metal efflux system|uniref:divalent metal ion exporter adaptor subunit IhpB n=1 Tax=Hyphomicrobiales TaxID=356 RepID=UPI00070C76FD|nr:MULTISPECIES: efflux RND transporter periplasmic adaptor subunit [unclassified Bradyrhizobium]KQT22632.1 hemolysin D [Bradyrhizobium sp. Leaf396]MDF2117334.1 efflux RND transporter periplasmic adaptor subunit [Roseiarcaceae bacterium H3SJ34-1]